ESHSRRPGGARSARSKRGCARPGRTAGSRATKSFPPGPRSRSAGSASPTRSKARSSWSEERPRWHGRAAARVPSIHRHAARLDRPGPLLDLVLDELAEIFRRGAVIGDDHGAAPFEPLLHRRRLHLLGGGVLVL